MKATERFYDTSVFYTYILKMLNLHFTLKASCISFDRKKMSWSLLLVFSALSEKKPMNLLTRMRSETKLSLKIHLLKQNYGSVVKVKRFQQDNSCHEPS